MKTNAFSKIQLTFWSDSKIMSLDFLSKYTFLFLLTADGLSSAGVIDLSLPLASALTAVDVEYLDQALGTLESMGLIRRSDSTNEILIVNYSRYNWNLGKTPQLRTIKKDLELIKDPEFKSFVADILTEKMNPEE